MRAIDVVLVSSFVLAGCGRVPGRHYTVHLDPVFTEDESSLIIEALDDWRSKVPVRFDVEVSSCVGENNGHICMHPGDPRAHGGTSDAGGCTKNGLDALGPIDGHEVYLRPLIETQDHFPTIFPNLSRHELGHAMGLDHSKAGSIMCIVVGCQPQPGYVTDNDVDQWWEIRR